VEKNKIVRVELVNPPIPDPWRTKADYLDDQRRQQKLYRASMLSMWISLIGVIATDRATFFL
jgi:hypothetical protein